MIHAYNELYLNDAMKNLGVAFDYGINTYKINPDSFSQYFTYSRMSKLIEIGNPNAISGISGIELTQEILKDTFKKVKIYHKKFKQEKTKEYWAGYVLAYYQWHSCKKFQDILDRISLNEIINLYPIYHEMDISHFVNYMDKAYKEREKETKLAIFRKNIGLSQSELAEKSTVSLRSIQLYEQRINDIDKAQAHTLFKLSIVLKCSIEDLLEYPEEV